MSQAAAGKILRNLSPTAPVRDHKAVPDLMAERQSTWISQAQLNSIQRRREQFDGPLPRFQDWNINEYEAASSFPTVSANESALPSDSGEGFSSTDDEDDLPELVHLQKFCFLFFFGLNGLRCVLFYRPDAPSSIPATFTDEAAQVTPEEEFADLAKGMELLDDQRFVL